MRKNVINEIDGIRQLRMQHNKTKITTYEETKIN